MPTLLLWFAPEAIDGETIAQIEQLAAGRRVVVANDTVAVEDVLNDVEIVAGPLPTKLLAQMPALRWFQQWGAGADWLMRHPDAVERPFVLTNASGVHAIPISEHIMGMVLMFARGLHRAVRAQERQTWWRAQRANLFELEGKTMLLVGVGAIGERTARLAGAFGMRVEGIRRDPAQSVVGVAAMYGDDQLRERLAHADVVVLTVPLSPATQNMFGADEFQAMKNDAYLVNIGRGGTVDEAALVAALRDGRIAGAALDVFAAEPLPATSPLWSMENVIITSHYAGMTPHYNERAMAIFLDNLRRYAAGEPLHNEVDKHAGY